MTKEEEEEVQREQKIKEEAFSKLRAREEELVQIKESQIKAKRTEEMEKKKKKKKEVKINSEAFINYFKMYYDKDRPQVCCFLIWIMSFDSLKSKKLWVLIKKLKLWNLHFHVFEISYQIHDIKYYVKGRVHL